MWRRSATASRALRARVRRVAWSWMRNLHGNGDANGYGYTGPGPLLPPFRVEKWQGWDAQKKAGASVKVLSNAECEPLFLRELLEMADNEMRQSYEEMWLGYTHSQGCPVLRQDIAANMLVSSVTEGGGEAPLTITPHEVQVVVPAEGIFLAVTALVQPGDSVVCSMPCYQSLHQVAETAGCKIVPWLPSIKPCLSESSVLGSGRSAFVNVYHFDVEEVKSLILQERPKLVVVNFPHNPTGATISPSQMLDLVGICRQVGCFLLCDEMYRGLEHEGVPTLPPVASLYDKAISLGGVSKSLSLPGLRIGWLATKHATTARKIAQLKDYTTICSSRPAEILASIAIRNKTFLLERNRSIIELNKRHLKEFVVRHERHLEWIEPEAGTFAFVKLRGGNAAQYARKLIELGDLCILPSELFGREAGDDSLRVTLGRSNTRLYVDEWERLIPEMC